MVHCSFQQHVQEYLANHLSFCSTSTFPKCSPPSFFSADRMSELRQSPAGEQDGGHNVRNQCFPAALYCQRGSYVCVRLCGKRNEKAADLTHRPSRSVSVPCIQVGNLSSVLESVNGVARCPYDPRHNSTAVVTESGELYAATVIDFSGRDPVIYRSLGGMPPLRTAQYNSKWLNGTESLHDHTDVLFECHLFKCVFF